MAIAAAAAIERHPHLAQHTPAGFVRVDMHSHTMFSGDSTTTLDEIAESVVEAGIDVLCVTDHNAIEGALRLQRALEGDGVCRVVVGEEVRTHTGEIIGYSCLSAFRLVRRPQRPHARFALKVHLYTFRTRLTPCVAISLKHHWKRSLQPD